MDGRLSLSGWLTYNGHFVDKVINRRSGKGQKSQLMCCVTEGNVVSGPVQFILESLSSLQFASTHCLSLVLALLLFFAVCVNN